MSWTQIGENGSGSRKPPTGLAAGGHPGQPGPKLASVVRGTRTGQPISRRVTDMEKEAKTPAQATCPCSPWNSVLSSHNMPTTHLCPHPALLCPS